MDKHTPEPWRVNEWGAIVSPGAEEAAHNRRIVSLNGVSLSSGVVPADDVGNHNRDRAVACVNACTGLTTAQLQALPAGHFAKVVEAATAVADEISDTFSCDELAAGGSESLLGGFRDTLRAALAPFTTQEPADAKR